MAKWTWQDHSEALRHEIMMLHGVLGSIEGYCWAAQAARDSGLEADAGRLADKIMECVQRVKDYRKE